MRNITYIYMVIMIFLSGCVSQEEHNKVREESTSLRQELAAVKKQLSDIKYEPARMMNEIRLELKRNDWLKAATKAKSLITNHPGSPEAIEAQEIINISKTIIEDSSTNTLQIAHADIIYVPGMINEDYRYIYEKMKGITLWKSPDKTAIAGFISEPGAAVEVVERQTNFWCVKYKDITGWASVQLLTGCSY